MRTSAKKRMAKVSLILATILFTSSPLQAATYPFAGSPAVSSDHLDSMRGGFITKSGFQISLGIERAIIVDGVLQTVNTLNIPNLADLKKVVYKSVMPHLPRQSGRGEKLDHLPGPSVAALTAVQEPVVAVATDTQTPAVANSAVPLATEPAIPAVTQAPAPVTPAVTPAPAVAIPLETPAATATAPETNVTVQGNVPVEVAASSLLPETQSLVYNSGLNTVVQNNLNQKNIQSLTIINTTVTNANLVREIQMMSRINEGLIQALR